MSIWGLAGLMVGVQLITQFDPGTLHGWIYWLGTVRTGAARELIPQAPFMGLPPYLLHVFIHFGWIHLLMNLGILLATGSAARDPFGPGWRGELGFLSFFFACALGGAVLHGFIHINETSTMAGASTAISGLIAAAGWARGGQALMLRYAVPWMGLNLLIGLAEAFVFLPLAWAGHIGGLLVGMIAYPIWVRVFRGQV